MAASISGDPQYFPVIQLDWKIFKTSTVPKLIWFNRMALPMMALPEVTC